MRVNFKKEALELESSILLGKDGKRMSETSLILYFNFDRKNGVQTRYMHSIEVANACELMSMSISERIGIDIDPMRVSRIVGMLHDVGHTAFSHLGEVVNDRIVREKSGGSIFYDSNSNNYVKLEKSKILNRFSAKNYILASLCKHIDNLYMSQKQISEIVSEECKRDLEYLRNNGFEVTEMKKTLQCSVMDIADEICYTLSDLTDSMVLLTQEELTNMMLELPEKYRNSFVEAAKGKNRFRQKVADLYIPFVENFTLSKDGEVVAVNQDLEELRIAIAKLNRKHILVHRKVREVRAEAEKLIEEVFSFLYSFESRKIVFPSQFYKKKFLLAKTRDERLEVIRDLCGTFTDKGIQRFYNKIKRFL